LIWEIKDLLFLYGKNLSAAERRLFLFLGKRKGPAASGRAGDAKGLFLVVAEVELVEQRNAGDDHNGNGENTDHTFEHKRQSVEECVEIDGHNFEPPGIMRRS